MYVSRHFFVGLSPLFCTNAEEFVGRALEFCTPLSHNPRVNLAGVMTTSLLTDRRWFFLFTPTHTLHHGDVQIGTVVYIISLKHHE